MASVQDVDQAAANLARYRAEATGAEAALKDQCRAAVEAGVPISKVAQAAGVTRTTVYAWLKEER